MHSACGSHWYQYSYAIFVSDSAGRQLTLTLPSVSSLHQLLGICLELSRDTGKDCKQRKKQWKMATVINGKTNAQPSSQSFFYTALFALCTVAACPISLLKCNLVSCHTIVFKMKQKWVQLLHFSFILITFALLYTLCVCICVCTCARMYVCIPTHVEGKNQFFTKNF